MNSSSSAVSSALTTALTVTTASLSGIEIVRTPFSNLAHSPSTVHSITTSVYVEPVGLRVNVVSSETEFGNLIWSTSIATFSASLFSGSPLYWIASASTGVI